MKRRPKRLATKKNYKFDQGSEVGSVEGEDFDSDNSAADVSFNVPTAELLQSQTDLEDEVGSDCKDAVNLEESGAAAVKQEERLDAMQRLLAHTTKVVVAHVGHHVLPSFPVFPETMQFSEMRVYPRCEISAPQPVYVAGKHANRIDGCHQRTINRWNYRQRLSILYTKYHTAQKRKKIRALEKRGEYHKSVFDIAERLALHPDRFFDSNYDYFYTGGNLRILPGSGHMLHVSGDNQQELNISEFAKTGHQLLKLCTRSLENVAEIYEIQPLCQSSGEPKNLFAVRQRSAIMLANLRESGSLRAISYLQSKGTPFISFAQSTVEPNTLVTTSMTQVLRRYDLVGGRPTFEGRCDLGGRSAEGSPSWNIVRAYKEQQFLYANPKQLQLVDLRSSPHQWQRCTTVGAFKCDLITSLMPSKFEHLVYVATTHKLHCLDMRYLGRHLEDYKEGGAVCRWTHQLNYPCAFIDSMRHGSDEWVMMASPLAGDSCVCELTLTSQGDKEAWRSFTMPYQPPSIEEAYEHARYSGYCLQPESDLQHRIRCCTTGLSIHHDPRTAESLLFTSTSNGDVFVCPIRERLSQEPEQRCNDVSDAMMAAYAGRVCELAQPVPKYTELFDMRPMRKIFRCSSLATKRDSDEPFAGHGYDPRSDDVPQAKRRNLGRWQKSMQTLHSYKDAIAADLLTVWDIDYEKNPNMSLRQIDANVTIKTDPAFKVGEWLAATSEDRPDREPATTLTQYSEFQVTLPDHFVSTQKEPGTEDGVNAMDTSALEAQTNPTTSSSKPKAKATRKKASYVKGF